MAPRYCRMRNHQVSIRSAADHNSFTGYRDLTVFLTRNSRTNQNPPLRGRHCDGRKKICGKRHVERRKMSAEQAISQQCEAYSRS